MSFSVKKINNETLGEYLRQLRQDRGLSLASVAEQTGVPQRWLEIFESEQSQHLPPDVYVRGFLTTLAKFYRTEAEVLFAQYRKEREVLERLTGAEVVKSKQTRFSPLVTPKIISLALAVLVVASLVSYIGYQLWTVNPAPALAITNPVAGSRVTGNSTEISGTTDPGIVVSINNVAVFVNSEGEFKAQVALQPGPQQVRVAATNKFGNRTEKVLDVVVEGQVAGAKIDGLKLGLMAVRDVKISLEVLGQLETREMTEGEVWEVLLSNPATVSATDGGAVSAMWDGQELGLLGVSGQSISGVVFDPAK